MIGLYRLIYNFLDESDQKKELCKHNLPTLLICKQCEKQNLNKAKRKF